MEKLYAEDLGHYWMTSKSSPDRWVRRIRALIEKHDGVVLTGALRAICQATSYCIDFLNH